MAHVLRMPGVAANATEAVLSEWLVEESADFAAADALATVETEKAAVDVEADAAGRVLKILVPPGAQVEVGDPIAVLGDPGELVEDLDALLASLGVAPATDVTVPERRDVPSDPESAAPLAEEARARQRRIPRPAGRPTVASSPARWPARSRRSRAPHRRDHGSGPRGRILRRDVDAAIADQGPPTPPRTSRADPSAEAWPRRRRDHRAATYDEVPTRESASRRRGGSPRASSRRRTST